MRGCREYFYLALAKLTRTTAGGIWMVSVLPTRTPLSGCGLVPTSRKGAVDIQVAISETVALHGLYWVEPPTARMRTL